MSGAARHTLPAAVPFTLAQIIAAWDAREIWRRVPGYPYEVSSWGKVRRIGSSRPLRVGVTDGYEAVCLCRNGRKTMARVHRLVVQAFWGNALFLGAEAMHSDGTRKNNRIGNVRWGTRLENNHDQDRHGTRAIGKRHGHAKLTEADIPKLDRVVAKIGIRPAARRFGLNGKTVHDAYHRVNWKHVPRTRVAA